VGTVSACRGQGSTASTSTLTPASGPASPASAVTGSGIPAKRGTGSTTTVHVRSHASNVGGPCSGPPVTTPAYAAALLRAVPAGVTVSLRIAWSFTGTPTLALALTSSSIASWCGSSCTVTFESAPSTRNVLVRS
jgi:hypothetical protein